MNQVHPKPRSTAPVYYNDIEQGTDEWFDARLGILTASQMGLVITPTLKVASNENERQHLYDLAAQRITRHIDEGYVSFAMNRGHMDEEEALLVYASEYESVKRCGFITNDKWGFKLGYSPDALVGDYGLIEVKSQMPKYHAQTILDHVVQDGCQTIPRKFMLQIQTGLLVSEREWCDFVSFCGGMPMVKIRVFPDRFMQDAIIDAAQQFNERLHAAVVNLELAIASGSMPATKRIDYNEEMVI